MNPEAEIGGMLSHVKECLRPSIGSWKRQEAFSPRALGGSAVLPTPSFRTSGLHNHERVNFFCVSSPVKLPLVICHDNSRKLMHIVSWVIMKTGNKNKAE